MQNPYIILGIPETATDSEIKVALKSKVEIFCGRDLNNKDIEGNYLFQTYNEAAKILLNQETRKEVDRILTDERKTTSLIPTSTKLAIKVDSKEDFISYINIEIFKKNKFSKVAEPEKSNQRAKLKKLYLLVGEDNSTIFVWQDRISSYHEHVFKPTVYTHKFTLEATFTDQIVAEHIIKNHESCDTDFYFDGIIFEAGGIKSYVVPASKIVPVELIENGSINFTDLANLQNAIQSASREHPEVLKESFKTKKLGEKI